MNRLPGFLGIAVTKLLFSISSANAELEDLGGGLIYDSVHDITWLQDMNYADTTGHDDALYGSDTDGTMFWDDAVAWAENLVYNGHSDWRLPNTPEPCNGPNPCTSSEMGHLYWTDGITSENPGLFNNVRPGAYWSGSTEGGVPWFFPFSNGGQGTDSQNPRFYAVAVHPGKIEPISVPLTSSYPTFLFRIKDNDSFIYLLGSIHLLRPEDYPLHSIYEIAFDQVDKVIFEIDIDEAGTSATEQLLAEFATYQGGRTIFDDVPPQTVSQLQSYLAANGLGFSPQLEPWFYSLLINNIEAEKVNALSDLGVDQFFFDRAKDFGKPIEALETVQFQLELFDQFPMQDQVLSLVDQLSAVNEIGNSLLELIDIWANEMNAELEELFESLDSELDPSIFEDRNRNWMPRLRTALMEDERVMVIVGAGHLFGEDGLIHLLRAEGYAIEGLPLPDWIELEMDYSNTGKLGFVISGSMGKNVSFEYSDDLSTSSWTRLSFDIFGDEPLFKSDQITTENKRRFYRAVLLE